jgi:very-short-patch-repair endonuclease
MLFRWRFVVDFFAASLKLVVEVDGGMHDDAAQRERDIARERELEAVYGVRFVRLRAELFE